MLGKNILEISLREYSLKKMIATCVIPKIDRDKDTTILSSNFESNESVFATVREVKKTTNKPKT